MIPIKKGLLITAILVTTLLIGCNYGPESHAAERESSAKAPSIVLEPSVSESPATQSSKNKSLSSNNKHVHVYVENSGSMYGYVGAGSQFRSVVYNYLTDIKLAEVASEMHLNFINSKPIPVNSSLDDFVKKLDPTSFKVSGGNSGATDITEIIKKIYPKNGYISVLISDCIVSPGKGKNASNYLDAQQTGLKEFIGSKKNLSQTGFIIYRMIGNFDGPYYNKLDDRRPYCGPRPYYIWVIGDVQSLKKMRETIEPKMKTKPDKICVVTMGNPKINYNIVAAGGKYKISHKNKYAIEKVGKVKTQQGSRVIVKINVDYSQMLQDETYLTNASNYTLSDPQYHIDNIMKMQNGHYIITISCPNVKKGVLTVALKNKEPQWVKTCSDDIGGFPDSKAKLQTTYGLSYLIGGVFDAYTFNRANLAEMKITIQ